MARRLVARTLGVQLSQEQREREKVQRMELQMARGKRREGRKGTSPDYKWRFLHSTKESRSSSITLSAPDFPSSPTDLYLLHHATTVQLVVHKNDHFLYTH